MSSFQYTAHCRRCSSSQAMTRAQVYTGRNPQCDGCGETMVVYSGTGDPPEIRLRPDRTLEELRGQGLA